MTNKKSEIKITVNEHTLKRIVLYCGIHNSTPSQAIETAVNFFLDLDESFRHKENVLASSRQWHETRYQRRNTGEE